MAADDVAARLAALPPDKRQQLLARLRARAAEAGPRAAGASAGPASHLIPIQPRGSGRPFFCVHPSSGGVFHYLELARVLGPAQPLYGIQAAGVDGEGEPPGSIEEMAAVYVEAVLEAQRDGPYRVGGWSLGGVIALEIARQLRRRGREVAVLALLDAPVPTGAEPAPDDALLSALFLYQVGGLIGTDFDALHQSFRAIPTEAHPAAIVERGRAMGILPADAEVDHIARRLRVFAVIARAAVAYRAHPYDGRTVLFRAEGSPDTEAGWRRLAAGSIEIVVVPGHHFSMLNSPHVETLGPLVQRCLDAPA